jgi:hypothetical protein
MKKERAYSIINVSDIPNIDFNNVLETSKDTLRKSIYGTKAIIKWSIAPNDINEDDNKEKQYTGSPHDSIKALKIKYYTYEQILKELEKKEWVDTTEKETVIEQSGL